MESFEAHGEWWLPENPEVKVPGTLAVDQDGSAELRLIGSLRSPFDKGASTTVDGVTKTTFSEESMEQAGVYRQITGQVENHFYTLEDCIQTRRRGQLFGRAYEERIRVHYVLKGIGFDVDEPLEFDSIAVSLEWLPDWVQKTGFDGTDHYLNQEDGLHRAGHSLTVNQLEPERFTGPSGSECHLRHSYSKCGDGVTTKGFTQDFYFGLRYSKQTALSDLLSDVGILQDLVTMGSGRVAAFKSVTLTHPDITRDGPGGKKYQPSINLFAPWQVRSEVRQKALTERDMFFSLPTMGGVEGVERWVRIATKYRSQLSRVMGTRYSEAAYSTDNLLSCAAALESYDREKHGDKRVNFIDRLRRCIEVGGKVFSDLVGDTEVWAGAVKDNRNWVAHHLESIDGASAEQIVLSDSAYWLFVICLLRDSEAPDAAFESMRGHADYRRLQRQLATVRELEAPRSGALDLN